LISRWLRHRSRVPRWLRAAAAVVLAALWLVGLAAPASPGAVGAAPPPAPGATAAKLPIAPAPGDPTRSFPTSPALVARGYNLYQQDCSSCHGLALRGRAGVAPSLIGVGPGPVDFYLSTGRMPLEQPREEPMRAQSLYDRTQIDALIAYVSRFGGPAAPTANPGRGDLALGLHVFTVDCAGCHQSVARGGLTLGAQVPALQPATGQEVAEAVRMGPYLMPRFTTAQIDQHQLDSIARYVLWTRNPSNAGGWGIYNLGPIPEGMVAWFMGLLAMVIVARLIGERLDEGTGEAR
jgi:ubiquinol-cytochrome c reductase cytochrome c subunit